MPISDWSSDVCSSDLGNEAKAIKPANRMALDDHRAVLVDRAQEPAAAGHPADEDRVAAIDAALRQAVMQGVREPVLDRAGAVLPVRGIGKPVTALADIGTGADMDDPGDEPVDVAIGSVDTGHLPSWNKSDSG